jgi:TolB-like protein/DNA-binding winged helix-turn-helix (wHTH) protein/tetratricopeptide (TPR) repeat protein
LNVPVLGRTTARFGPFELDLQSVELRKAGVVIHLQQQPLKVLALLATRPGEVISREEIKRHIWSVGTFVDFEQGVNFCIKQVRVALRDNARKPRYIETLPRRGYRFLAPVEEIVEVREHTTPAPIQMTSLEVPKAPGGKPAIRIAALCLVGVLVAWAVFYAREHLRPHQRVASNRVLLAVLPFSNLSGDAEQDYLSDGMTEEMIAQLGRLDSRQLAVIGRPSVMNFKNVKKSVDQIGRELGVNYILEGSIRLAAGRIRVTAQLMQVIDSTLLWVGCYDRDLRDILAVQDDVAMAISRNIMIRIDPKNHHTSHPADSNVYQLYLEGRFFLNKRSLEGINSAIQYFEHAIAADADFAPAYAGLADCYTALGYYGFLPPRNAYPQAKVAAIKALTLNDDLAEAHIALAGIERDYDWDWSSSEREFKRGIELDPGSPSAHLWYAAYLSTMGRPEEAIAEATQALQLDPLSPLANMTLGLHLHYARREEKAIEQLRKAVEFDPTFAVGHLSLGRSYEALKKYSEAASEFELAVVQGDRSPVMVAALARAYALSGERSKALALLNELQELSKRRYVSAYDIALVQLGIGNVERGFEWLQKACEERSGWLVSIRVDPRFDALRQDHRLIDLESKIGFPQ